MILISIQPFAFKKLFALGATLLCLSTASCFADALFLSVNSTPYDRQISRVQPALKTAAKPAARPASVETNNSTYVLELTLNWTAYRSEELRGGSYAPLYAYSGT
jgi:hypothetical protein